MQSYLDFEKPVADLEGKIAELKSLSGADKAVSIDDEVARADRASRPGAGRHLQEAHALAAHAGGAPSAAAAFFRLRQDR